MKMGKCDKLCHNFEGKYRLSILNSIGIQIFRSQAMNGVDAKIVESILSENDSDCKIILSEVQ